MASVPNRFDRNRLISNREIRIFLSSTFVDLEEERSALIRVFEKIKYEIKKREVYLTVVDLRWGVTEEESKEGKVISVCLNEIENSHPFFIGLLGNRYGYAPNEQDLIANPELAERYPWIKNDIEAGLSITEIEMQYGALRQQEETDAAFFIKTSTNQDDNPRLTKLKETILKQDKFEVHSYELIEDLCEKVEKAVHKIVDKYFPLAGSTSSLPWSQATYLSDYTRFYIRNTNAYSALDAFVQNENDRFMIIAGESGVGKTALMANWIRERSESGLSIISHFVGDSISGNSKQKVLSSLYLALKGIMKEERYADESSPSKEAIEELLIHHSDTGQKLVLVIDALNQLQKQDKDSLFEWFPIIPKGIKVVFTTVEEDPSLDTYSRHYPLFHLRPLEKQKREAFIISYLLPYGKKLSSSQLDRILNDRQNENTLILKTLLNELICYGSYQHLDERIDYYLEADSFLDFFDRVLARLEQDYSKNQDIVKTVLSLIYLSKDGLSEEEILGITRFREVDWRLFFCAFYGNLVSRKGLLSFSHQVIAQAICRRYDLANPQVAQTYRESIIAHFDSSEDTDRRTIELAYQYYNVDSCDKLYDTVLSFEAFSLLNEYDSWLLASYWRKLLECGSGYSLADYLNLRKESDAVVDLPLCSIAHFIGNYFPNFSVEMQYYNCYLRPDLKLAELLQDNFPLAEQIYLGVAGCCGRVGRLDMALRVYEILLKYYKKPADISNTLNAIGHIYEHNRDYKRALDYYNRSIEASLNSDHVAHAINYVSIAGVYKNQRKYEDAITLYLKAIDIFETYNGCATAAMGCFIGLGYIYGKMKQKETAVNYVEKGLSALSKEYGKHHPLCFFALQNAASIYLNNDDHDNALKTLLRIVDTFETNIFTRIKTKEWIKVYGDIGKLYYQKKEYLNSIEYYQKAIQSAKNEPGLKSDIVRIYGKISSVYFETEKYENAAEALEKAAEYFDDSIPLSQKIQNYVSVGVLYRAAGKMEKALNSYEKALKHYYIPSLLSHDDEKVPEYEDPAEDKDISDVYLILKEYPESLERAFLSIIKELGEDHPFSVFQAYRCIAGAYYDKENFTKALEAVQHIIKAIEKNYSNNYQYFSLAYSIAGVLNVSLKSFDEALEYYQKALEISQGLGENNPTSAKVYYRIGQVYFIKNDYPQALSFYEKSIAMSEASSSAPDLEPITSLGLVYEILKNKEEAIKHYNTVINLYDGNIWMTDAYIKAASRLGNIYSSKQEELTAFEYFLRGADAYDKKQPNHQDEAVYCCRMSASIAVKSAQEAVNTKKGYDNALKLLRDSYHYMSIILGDSNIETKVVRAWEEMIVKELAALEGKKKSRFKKRIYGVVIIIAILLLLFLVLLNLRNY